MRDVMTEQVGELEGTKREFYVKVVAEDWPMVMERARAFYQRDNVSDQAACLYLAHCMGAPEDMGEVRAQFIGQLVQGGRR